MSIVRIKNWFCVLTMALISASCASRPEGVMKPVAALPAMTRQVDMLVATTRIPSGNPNTLFTGERSPKLHLTDIAVSVPENRNEGTVTWPRRLPPDPRTDFAVTRAATLSSTEAARSWFSQHSVGGHVLVFIHGFNNRYEDSVFRFAQIIVDSGAQTTPVLFTWPSRASVLAYNYDKESTNYSRTALEELLRTMAEAPRVKDVTILAHSMGTWLAMEALRQMAIRDGRVAPKIENVILASPDIDLDVFAKQWTELGSTKPNFTIFVSQDDRALAASRLISGRVTRLGAINPAEEPYRSKLERAGITALDLTEVQTEDSLRHGKFAQSPEIVKLIGQRLAKGQTLTDSTVSLGDGIATVVSGTASTVGAIAATTISAPIKVLEPERKSPPTAVLDETLEN